MGEDWKTIIHHFSHNKHHYLGPNKSMGGVGLRWFDRDGLEKILKFHHEKCKILDTI